MYRMIGRGGRTLLTVMTCLALALSAPLMAEKKGGPGKVSINQATTEQWQALPGVGPALAKRIIEHRTKNGPFKKMEDLMSVKGMGEKKFMKLRDRLTL